MKILIIPDVHGRPFWSVAKEHVDDYDKIIFLGDYHDPYPHEGILTHESLNNFKEILSFAKGNEKKVVMLLGNHDLTYIDNMCVGADRVDYANEAELKKLFRENDNLFRLAYADDVDGNDVLFTHAGVHPLWKKVYFNDVGNSNTDIANFLNNWFEVRDDRCIVALNSIGAIRGGWGNSVGSCVWCDVEEMENTEKTFDFYQVFGHSQPYIYEKDKGYVLGDAVITPNFACLDVHKAFEINKGQIKEVC